MLFDDDVVLPGKLSMSSSGYAQCFVNGKVTLFHRWLLGLDGGGHERIADHINRDKLDNRRENLRIVSPRESNFNRVLRDRGLPTGVYRSRKGKPYRAMIFPGGGASKQIGQFDTPEEAAAARAAF